MTNENPAQRLGKRFAMLRTAAAADIFKTQDASDRADLGRPHAV
jgi:hypothetical protein